MIILSFAHHVILNLCDSTSVVTETINIL